jgi:poly-gamma-glutamate synthesis protein (capsule biosynthesis protein)
VTLAFGGDVHFEAQLHDALLGQPENVLAPIRPLFSDADVSMVNLETAVTDGGVAEHKTYVFRAPALAFSALRAAGVTAATMGNNHALDYGAVGLADTLGAVAASGFPVIGIGANAQAAYAPFRTVVKGQRISIIGATDILPPGWDATESRGGVASAHDLPRLLGAVAAERAHADTLAVFLHWGVEGVACPVADQQGLARALVGAGADIVVGSHPHIVQGEAVWVPLLSSTPSATSSGTTKEETPPILVSSK